MNNYFAFIDESGVLDESSKVQPYFAVGFLRIDDTSVIGEKLTQKHYDYFSTQKERRKQLLADLKMHPRTLSDGDLNLLLVSTRHYEYKFTNITYTTLERYKSFKEFVDHLIRKLEVPSAKKSDHPLTQSITCHSPIYFSVWPLRLSQTKSGGV